MVRFKVLIENKTNNPGIVAEHGLSIYIEAYDKKILFDGGATDLFADNAGDMSVDLTKVDLAVISHGHYDHTGGFPLFHEANPSAQIYLSKYALKQSYDDNQGKEKTGILWSEDEKDKLKDSLVFTNEPIFITKDIVVSGFIPKDKTHTQTSKFYFEKDGQYVVDDMRHEQFLAIRDEKGITLFSGCSHKGVAAAVNYCKELFPGEKIYMLVAGMHLYSASLEERNKVIDKVIKEDIEIIVPVHCTGVEGICSLKNKLGDRCIVATAGDSYGY